MRAVRVVRGARGCLSVVAARRAPPFGSDFGRQWCLCTKTARPTRFSTRKAVQGGAEGAWGLGSECCGQALRWRRVCAPVLRRQRCACERLTSRGVRGRVGFRFGRPVFWAGAGAEGLRRWPASLLQTALGAEAGPAPASSAAAVSQLESRGRSVRERRAGPGALNTRTTLVVAHRTSSAPRGAAADARRPDSCFPLHAIEQNLPQGRRIDGVGANVLYHTTWAALPARPRSGTEITPRSHARRRESEEGNAQKYLVSALDLNLHTRGARALV